MKSQRGELAIRLAAQGAIDNESLLETLEWPDKEKVMQRMQAQLPQPGAPGAAGPAMQPQQ
jgi:hypothetical protein